MTETEKSQTAPPVHVSGDALRVLSDRVRTWTGWRDARLVLGQPPHGSPFALTEIDSRTMTVNIDDLLINPNRVLLTVTPFRLRQEAILTGVMLHEAGHARHSRWLNDDGTPPLHSPEMKRGPREPATAQTVALARLMEEPRVEGLIAQEAKSIGAGGLAWTMRASAAHLMPMTELSADPDQQILDLIGSWALRAGRQIALSNALPGYETPSWVLHFTSLVKSALERHLTTPEWEASPFGAGLEMHEVAAVDPSYQAGVVLTTLRNMITCPDDTGPMMIDCARDVLRILFPEIDGDGDGAPMPSLGCATGGAAQPSDSESGDDGEGSEQGEGGEGNTDPEDEGSGDEPGAGDTGEGDEEGGEGEGDADDNADSDAAKDLAALIEALDVIEQEAKDQTASEVDIEVNAPMDDPTTGTAAGTGGSVGGLLWRSPTPDERGVQKNAERFLRSIIDPTEVAKVSLTDAPAATVDGAALSAWKAGGEIRAPYFFRRTRREVADAPPAQIAVLVDVSISMSILQRPSALLSWALACAALDLRNFAGRGTQVSSCLIHWGNTARLIQSNGQVMPGILDWHCGEGTRALDEAHDLVEEQMPGFFTASDKPSNRLLVQFTDWELGGDTHRVTQQVRSAMNAGVNMLSVVPANYSPHGSHLSSIHRDMTGWRGKSSILRYNAMFPEQVWDHAAEMLGIGF